MRPFLSKLLFTIAFFLAVLSAASIIMLLCGLRPFILKSGSMEPEYTAGSLVWVNTNVNVDDVKIGDVLVYRANTGTLVLHRLVTKDTFKGDAIEKGETCEIAAFEKELTLDDGLTGGLFFGWRVNRCFNFFSKGWCSPSAEAQPYFWL